MDVIGDHLVYKHGFLRLWPERGLIHIEDARDGSYECVSVRTMLHRVKAHADMLRNSREEMKRSGFMPFLEYERIQRMIEAMTDILGQAKIQGMPTDASARRDLVRRRPKTVLMPGTGNAVM